MVHYSQTMLAVLAFAASSALSAPLSGDAKGPSLAPRQSNLRKACLTKYEPFPGGITACGFTMAQAESFSLPYVSIPKALFEETLLPDRNPNNNPVCRRVVHVKNLRTQETMDGVVVDLNGRKDDQHCYKDDNVHDPSGDFGPTSLDIDQTGLDQLKFDDGPLAGVEYTIDWTMDQLPMPV